MNVEFRASFARDPKRIKDTKLEARVRQVIDRVERAQCLQEVESLKKLRGGDRYYRIRIGDYRGRDVCHLAWVSLL